MNDSSILTNYECQLCNSFMFKTCFKHPFDESEKISYECKKCCKYTIITSSNNDILYDLFFVDKYVIRRYMPGETGIVRYDLKYDLKSFSSKNIKKPGKVTILNSVIKTNISKSEIDKLLLLS